MQIRVVVCFCLPSPLCCLRSSSVSRHSHLFPVCSQLRRLHFPISPVLYRFFHNLVLLVLLWDQMLELPGSFAAMSAFCFRFRTKLTNWSQRITYKSMSCLGGVAVLFHVCINKCISTSCTYLWPVLMRAHCSDLIQKMAVWGRLHLTNTDESFQM